MTYHLATLKIMSSFATQFVVLKNTQKEYKNFISKKRPLLISGEAI
jgi:hypothetical protein